MLPGEMLCRLEMVCTFSGGLLDVSLCTSIIVCESILLTSHVTTLDILQVPIGPLIYCLDKK